MIAINRVHYPITVLGYGQRIGIWTQGCSIRCEGCMSKDTWDFDSSKNLYIEKLVGWIESTSDKKPDGLTISGGEPFDQPEGLEKIIQSVHRWRQTLAYDFDILCYSGYSADYLRINFSQILSQLDTVIAEPYDTNLDKAYLRGSSNQQILIMSNLGNQRYGKNIDIPYINEMQIVVDKNEIILLGIPNKDDLEKLELHCKSKGLVFHTNTWG